MLLLLRCRCPTLSQATLVHDEVYGSLQASRFVGAPQYLLQVSDPSTGLPATTYDVAGLPTTQLYDLMGRLTCSAPEVGQGAGLKVVYRPAVAPSSLAEVEVSERTVTTHASCTLGAGTLSRQTQTFDELGRPLVEERLLPDGVWAKRRTDYDAMSRVTHRYEWTASSLVHSTKYQDYDPFGRPGKVVSPDGGVVTFLHNGDRLVTRTYQIGTGVTGTGNGTIVKTQASTVEHYDREGRLRQVLPPAASGAATASYNYDVGNRLSRVDLVAGGVTQTRQFNYDQRGFLLSENHPEANRVDYLSYDARGLLLRKVQASGGAGLTYAYDTYDRLTQVKETASGRLLKEFVYGVDDGGTANRRLGKVTGATRHNWVRLPWAAGSLIDVKVIEGFVYGGVGGRLSSRSTAVVGASGYYGDSFSTSWAYDQRGGVASVTYPRCTHALCDVTSTGDPARTVGFTYDQGWLETVPGYGTLTLHPNGMVHQVDHLNGRRDVYPADPFGMARPSNVQVFNTGTGALVTELGLHQYDPVGNLMTRGGDRYAYDLAGRLVRFQTSSGQYQTYGFDGFGNLTQVFKSDTGSTVTYATDATTNRLAMGSYDAAGNLLSMAPHSQTWDALDTLMQRGIQAETYLYTASDERVYVGVADADRTLPRMASETWTLRDQGGEVLTVYTTNGTRTTGAWAWQKDYVYRGTAVLAAVLPGNVVHHFTVDHLGTPRATWSSTGTLLGSQHYWGFGEHLGGNTTDPETKRFTGHERDLRGSGTADDLDYMHARYYSPTWGRFLSVDPILGGPKNPGSWNRYVYSLSNPLRYVDRDGMEPIEVNVKNLLEAFFAADLSHVDVQSGVVASAITKVAGASGVTVGNSIYLSLNGNEQYRQRSAEGVLLMAHEVAHTFDYQRLGVPVFLADYFGIQAFRGLVSTGTRKGAYDSITHEQRASAAESALAEFLQTDTGAGILGKVQAGERLSAADRRAINAFLIDKVTNGQFKLGFQIIEGQLVRVRMAQ